MIEAFLAGKTIQVRPASVDADAKFMNAEDFITEENYNDCRTLTVINRFCDSALRVKPPEPVVKHDFTRVYADGSIGSCIFTSIGDAMNSDSVIQVLKHTYVDGFFKGVEVVWTKE
jgi:hypothetical protein